MDSSQSSFSTLSTAVDESITTVQHILQEMFKAMHEGTFAKWAEDYLTEDILLGQGGEQSRGQLKVCEMYNKVLLTVWGLQSRVTWLPESFNVIGTNKNRVDAVMKQVVQQPGDRETVKRKKFEFELNECGKLSVLNCILLDVISASDQSAKPPVFKRPCCHNDWDSIRVKRNLCQLRCRICLSQWKLRPEDINRCPVFVEPGCKNSECALLHINRKKLRLAMV